MKYSNVAVMALLVYCGAGCTSDTPQGHTERTNEMLETEDSSEPITTAELPTAPPDCPSEGQVLEGNERWLAKERLLVRLVASQPSADARFGDSHRHLMLYDQYCNALLSEILEVDQSPDFPYSLVDIAYSNVNGWLAIQGYSQFYLLSLRQPRLIGPYRPEFLNERFAEDAQSGRINRLEVWENYLCGYAEDLGAFVFDLDAQEPVAVLPLAELPIDGGLSYHSLFLLQSDGDGGKFQLLAPAYNEDNRSFEVNPLLPEPMELDPNINRAFRNNRFLVLKALDAQGQKVPIAIDQLKRTRIELPGDIAAKKDTDIISWLRNNSR